MILTLNYIKEEAEQVIGSWNGKDERFIDHTGELRCEDDVYLAEEILEKVTELEDLYKHL